MHVAKCVTLPYRKQWYQQLWMVQNNRIKHKKWLVYSPCKRAAETVTSYCKQFLAN